MTEHASDSPAPARPAPARPAPTEEEMVAIVAAIEAVWPRPSAVPSQEPPVRWRFSGRWWSRPVPVRRGRPH